MSRARLCLPPVLLALLLIPAPAGAQDAPSPLVPYPEVHRGPVYSQDRYGNTPMGEPTPVEPGEIKNYSQDKFFEPEIPESYSEELRKIPAKGHEWSEVEIAKGAVALNADKFDEAIAHFKKALEHDPRNFVALEYIASTEERRGNYQVALANLARAKHIAPRARWGQIDFQMGRLYLMGKNYERAEIYLRLALDQGAQPTGANYTLGYLMYLEKRWFEAEYYLHDARMHAIRQTALAPERRMLQAIDYYLGEVYARLNFLQYAIVTLRETEIGDSWEVRNGAWRVHAELNHWFWYVTFGLFGQYDSNVMLVPIGGIVPVEFSSQASPASVLTINAGAQTSPTKEWVGGTDGLFYLNNHLNPTLGVFDVLDLAFDFWGMFWNRKDWSFIARYDFNDAETGRWQFTRFQSSNALSISTHYFPFQRWDWELGFQNRWDSYATDLPTGPDQRSGTAYVAFFKGSLKAPNPRFRPTIGFTFEDDNANGINFQSRNYTFLLEADFRAWARTHLLAGLTFEKSFFPNNLNGRLDTTETVRLGVNQIFNEHWLGVVDINSIEDDSTQGDFSYKRLVVTIGATYTL